MCKFNPKNGGRQIDPCMKKWVDAINRVKWNYHHVVACCCGHGKYPATVVIQNDPIMSNGIVWELFSQVKIPRTKKYYKKDAQGIYYIPETIGEKPITVSGKHSSLRR